MRWKNEVLHISTLSYLSYTLNCYGISMKAETHRLETDEEYTSRIEADKNKLKTNEARELAEYERLKKKFGI